MFGKKTFFQRIKKHHPNWYSIIVGAAIVMYWRGLWGLMDTYLFPGNEVLSYSASIVIGLLLLLANDFKLTEIES